MSSIITTNGYIGGVLSSVLFVPQIYKIIQSKRVDDISWTFILLSNIGSVYSLVYYIEIDATPMVYTNIFSLVSRIVLLCLKIYYQKSTPLSYHTLPLTVEED